MNIVYLGTDVFHSSFEYLLKNHNILAVYTYHADEDCLTEYGIAKRAKESGIPVNYAPISADDVSKYVKEMDCDLFFSAEYSYYIPVSDDEHFKGLNLHCSLLPEGRSYYPIECAMHQGREEFGVTMHKLVEKIDAGEIISYAKITRSEIEDSVDVYIACDKEALKMTQNLMENFDEVWNAAKKQDSLLPMQKRPDQSAMMINHDMTVSKAQEVFAKYNQMTQVIIDETEYYVVSVMFGKVTPASFEYMTSDNSVIYSLSDGNARMILRKVN